MSRTALLWSTACALALALACDDTDSGDEQGADFVRDAGVGAPCANDDECPQGSVCFDGTCVFQGGGAPGDGEGEPAGPDAPPPEPAPPEMEETLAPRNRPAAGVSVVWVAAPETDRVAAIDGAALTVTLVDVGDRPTAVAVRAGSDTAVVLCRGSDELIVVEPGGEPQTHRLPGHFNALAVGPAGRFAYAWFDLNDVEPGEDASAVQDVVVLDLDAGVQHPVSIGFGPREVVFAEDGTALFVTDDGVSVIAPARLDGPAVALTVPTAPDIFSNTAREVVLTADGRYAASRAPGERGITVVDLTEGVPRTVDLGAEPTDLDLVPPTDGAGHTALVMLREARQLALVPLDGEGEVRLVELGRRPLGSAAVSATGDRAVLYATRSDHPPAAALLALPGGEVIDVPLRKRARVGAVSGGVAWILHGPEPATVPLDPPLQDDPLPADMGAEDMGVEDMAAEDMAAEDMAADDMAPDDMGVADMAVADMAAADMTPSEQQFEQVVDPTLAPRHGYSLIDLDTGFVKLQTTAAEPYGLTFAPGAAFVAYPRAAASGPRLERIDLVRFDSRSWLLGSTAEAIGVLPAVERAFATQDHPTGRISFVPLETDGTIRTLTGYALDGRIE